MGPSLFLLNHKLHILGQENGSQILYAIYYYRRISMSMVNIYTEHIRSTTWKPHFVSYMLLQLNTFVNGYYQCYPQIFAQSYITHIMSRKWKPHFVN